MHTSSSNTILHNKSKKLVKIKISKKTPRCFFFSVKNKNGSISRIWVGSGSKVIGPRPDPDPTGLKILDPDPYKWVRSW